MSKIEKLQIPTVLAFEKKLVCSDGFLYGGRFGDENSYTPLSIIEKSLRGTMGSRQKASIASDPLKLNAKVTSANIQRVDSCSLGAEQNALKLKFSMKVLGAIHLPCSCNNTQFAKRYAQIAKEYIQSHGFAELAYRYASNIANGRTLWRNRHGASKIVVSVKCAETNDAFVFDGFSISVRHFNDRDPQVEALGTLIAKALCAKEGGIHLDVMIEAQVGFGSVIYPSQDLLLDDRSGSREKKSKVLYSNGGIAAFHDQKVANAIRTIDTWYSAYEETQIPIAIETFGAVTNMGTAFRLNVGENFYSIFDDWMAGNAPQNINDLHFVMATMVRGGVFGGSSDKE